MEGQIEVGSATLSRRTLLAGAGLSLGAIMAGLEILGSRTPASAAGTYLRPCPGVGISDSWQGHKNRNPPSNEPGTDYAAGMGTAVLAATDGVIDAWQGSNGPATGRYIALKTNDGNYIRYLHLSSSNATVGQPVYRGQPIALSGASGKGSDNGYPAHVHVSMWLGSSPTPVGNTVDFETYVGNDTTPTPQERNMEAIVKAPNGTVVHLRQGGKTDFGSAEQYNNFRTQVGTLRSLGATDIMPLPELSTVPGVTWETYTFLAQYLGAPA